MTGGGLTFNMDMAKNNDETEGTEKTVESLGKDCQAECSICKDSFEDEKNPKKLLPCMHMFHEICINNWHNMQRKKIPPQALNCPYCRLKIDGTSSYPEFPPEVFTIDEDDMDVVEIPIDMSLVEEVVRRRR